jgi:BREX protein BrxB
MSQVNNLIGNYRRHVGIPWQTNLAGRQRVWFAVYPPPEERRVRAQIKEFEIATLEAKHRWKLVDITDVPARWLAEHEYREAYFEEPSAFSMVAQDLKAHVVSVLREACHDGEVDKDTVVAVLGVGSLFGFIHLSGVIIDLEDAIRGRLLVFFPGEYERSVYRFMDARDGFNYMAVPITCSEGLQI